MVMAVGQIKFVSLIRFMLNQAINQCYTVCKPSTAVSIALFWIFFLLSKKFHETKIEDE